MSNKPEAHQEKPAKTDLSRRSLLKVGTAFAGGLVATALPEVRNVLANKDGLQAEARLPGDASATQNNTSLIAQRTVNSQTPLNDNPFAEGMKANTAVPRGGAHMYGAFSMETFCDAGPLSQTHEDAEGWLKYPSQFDAPNFHYKDSGVAVWAYYEEYDNWQDTYGMDAVRAVYHSGHGGMDNNGVFYASMGSNWNNQGCNAISSNMRLGNEYVRYIFWSTCQSLRVSGGQDPIRTWDRTNLGWRMLFGYETNSVDDPNYGKFFWEEWKKNKSFSTAFLDASWRISHSQSPAVVACGATAAEAKDRLFNERIFSATRSSTNYYHWRWYTAKTASRQSQLSLPQNLLVAELQPVVAGQESARALANRFQLNIRISNNLASAPDGSFRVASGDASISYSKDGSIDVQITKPNLSNRTQIAQQRAIALAQEAIQRYGLNKQVQLVLDSVSLSCEGSGTAKGSGAIQGPYVVGTLVQFRQVINGLAVITPGAGTVRISIDNDGKVTNVHSSVRAISRLTNRSRVTSTIPSPNGAVTSLASSNPANYEQMLAAKSNSILSSLTSKAQSQAALTFTTVPNSTEVGYDIRGNKAVLIAHKLIEVNFGGLYRKLYWVEVPLFE